MLGYEPPQPKLWKAVLGAGLIVFPVFYLLDVAIVHHQPGWLYLGISIGISLLLGYQMYSEGPASLRPIRLLWGRFDNTGVGAISESARSLIPRDDDKDHSDVD